MTAMLLATCIRCFRMAAWDKQDQQVVEDEDSTDVDCISETSTVSETHSSTDDGHLPSSKRRQYNPPELYQAKKQMDEAFSLLQYVCQQQQEEDEWTIFGKLIVMKMWRLLEEQRNFMMIKIDQILCEEQYNKPCS